MRRPVMYLAGLLLASGASLALAGPASAAPVTPAAPAAPAVHTPWWPNGYDNCDYGYWPRYGGWGFWNNNYGFHRWGNGWGNGWGGGWGHGWGGGW